MSNGALQMPTVLAICHLYLCHHQLCLCVPCPFLPCSLPSSPFVVNIGVSCRAAKARVSLNDVTTAATMLSNLNAQSFHDAACDILVPRAQVPPFLPLLRSYSKGLKSLTIELATHFLSQLRLLAVLQGSPAVAVALIHKTRRRRVTSVHVHQRVATSVPQTTDQPTH